MFLKDQERDILKHYQRYSLENIKKNSGVAFSSLSLSKPTLREMTAGNPTHLTGTASFSSATNDITREETVALSRLKVEKLNLLSRFPSTQRV